MQGTIKNTRNTGFSLIEMSMFVIMGLVVGGVLAGTSLKRSIQIKAVMDQESQLNQAMIKFKKIYGGWPGDLWNATDKFGDADESGNIFSNGNGDGRIYGNNGDGNAEHSQVMHQLAQAGLIKGGYDPTDGKILSHIYGPIDKKSIFSIESFICEPLTIRFGGITDDDDNGIVDWYTGIGINRAVFTPQEMRNIDTKYDDGNPDTANIHAYDGSNTPNDCVNTGAYVLTVSTNACYFGVRIETAY